MKVTLCVVFSLVIFILCCSDYWADAILNIFKGTVVSFTRSGTSSGKVKIKKIDKAKKYQVKYSSSKSFSN